MAIIRLDTPGGLADSMRSIIQDMAAAPMPVIVYVSPNGARAASAGAYITEAADVAAMAPETNIGSATPIAIGAGGGSQRPGPEDHQRRGCLDAGPGGRPRPKPEACRASWSPRPRTSRPTRLCGPG